MKISISARETYSTMIIREPVIIETDNYPELDGMSEDEIKDYLIENLYELKTNNEYYVSLGDEIVAQDPVREKIYGEDTQYIFNED